MSFFGEEQAQALENACFKHEGEHIGYKQGSDPFKYVLVMTIGCQCFEVKRYREAHGITVPYEELKAWIKQHGALKTYDGDVDYLTLSIGAYAEYLGGDDANDES